LFRKLGVPRALKSDPIQALDCGHHAGTFNGRGVMACLSKERKDSNRIHWKFRAKLGPRAGETFEGRLHLGRCTKTAAKAKQRDIEEGEERVKIGRFVPDCKGEEIFKLWLHERDLTCTPQTMERSRRVMAAYRAWRESRGLPCETVGAAVLTRIPSGPFEARSASVSQPRLWEESIGPLLTRRMEFPGWKGTRP
jgi:hypothetical protein